MRFLNLLALAAAGALGLVGCAPKQAAPKVSPFDRTVKADCYTVDLFTPADAVAPGADVPAAWRGFSGSWGGGAWEGVWCHDLHVISISSSGEVDLIEAHAPLPQRGYEATAFRRKGQITEEGKLRIGYKNISVEYELVNGRLLGVRREYGAGQMRIKLAPKQGAA